MLKEALAEMEKHRTPDPSAVKTTIYGQAYARAGMKKDTNEILEILRERSKKEYIDPIFFAGNLCFHEHG
jgi:hypothetical protein